MRRLTLSFRHSDKNNTNMLDEYITNDVCEMAYLYYKGFPYEYDRSNPQKVKMIFKGDTMLLRSMVRDMWESDEKSQYFLKHWNAGKAIKQSLWIDGVYKPGYYKKSPEADIKREIENNETITFKKES